jgi:hypothetical protein
MGKEEGGGGTKKKKLSLTKPLFCPSAEVIMWNQPSTYIKFSFPPFVENFSSSLLLKVLSINLSSDRVNSVCVHVRVRA